MIEGRFDQSHFHERSIEQSLLIILKEKKSEIFRSRAANGNFDCLGQMAPPSGGL
jgi:hypothetical protein